MMQMLSAGGMDALTDGLRTPDPNNPRGYYEFELVKSLAQNSEIMGGAEGKVVKVISSLLTYLPGQYQYGVIFMRRPLQEIVASQDRMLERLGREVPAASKESVLKAFGQHLTMVRSWLARQKNISVLYVDYAAVLEDAYRESSKICAFLERDLNIDSMTRKVEHSLHREKVQV